MPKTIHAAHTLLIVLLALLCACAAPPRPTLSVPAPADDSQPAAPEPATASPTLPSDSPTLPSDSATPTPKTAPPTKILSGALSIVALGDSLTQGDGDESGQGGYPNRLAQRIEAQHPGVTVLNLGRSGWTSKDLLEGVNGEAAIVPQALAAKPNIALVWIGSNDLWYLYEYGPDPMTQEAEQQDLQAYAANIEAILSQLKASNASVFVALLDDQSKRPVVANPPDPSQPAFSAITHDDLARMSVHAAEMNKIIRQKAAEQGAFTVDFASTTLFTDPATLFSDGNHPNTAGYEKITQIWYQAIQPHLK
jgi:lysophospholipase L1-like esterase